MAGVYVNLDDIDTTREVLLSGPPRGVRNLILIAAAVLVAVTVMLGFLRVQQTQTVSGVAVAADQPRVITATAAGAVSFVGAANGEAVDAGQTILYLDTSNEQSQLTVLQQQEDQNKADIANYEQVRQAALAGTNPFDPATQATFYYLLVQYKQDLAQAADNAAQTSQQQSSTRNQAQAALNANQGALGGINGRISQLSALAQAIQTGSAYSSNDSYCQSLYQSWKAGLPDPGSAVPTTASGQSVQDYSATFITQIQSEIASLQSQQDSYSTQVAQLQSQLNQPVINPTQDPKAAVTANFMLSATSAEQQLQTNQATIALQAMSLQLQISQATIVAPIAGVLETASNWQVGDQVQSGQQVFQVVPASATFIQAMVPPSAIAAVSVGESIPCSVPDDPSGHAATISCHVDYVPSSFDATQNNQAFYGVRLSVAPGSNLAGYGSSLPAGLSVTLTIPVKQSSALRWLGEKIGLVKED